MSKFLPLSQSTRNLAPNMVVIREKSLIQNEPKPCTVSEGERVTNLKKKFHWPASLCLSYLLGGVIHKLQGWVYLMTKGEKKSYKSSK